MAGGPGDPKKGDRRLPPDGVGYEQVFDGTNWVDDVCGHYWMASGALTPTAAPWEFFMGGSVGFKGSAATLRALATKRWFRKYIFSASTTKQGGNVYTAFGRFKYVGERVSYHGIKIQLHQIN